MLKFGFKFRLAAFAVGMGLTVLVIVSSAVKSWQRIAEVRERLTQVQSESLRIAEQFRHSLWTLSDSLVRYGASHNLADWEQFNRAASELDAWIDEQKPKLNTPREKDTMQQIDVAYDDYRAAAKEVRAKVEASPERPTPVDEFSRVRTERERLTELGLNLAEAHRER